jgi:hypothetical protein
MEPLVWWTKFCFGLNDYGNHLPCHGELAEHEWMGEQWADLITALGNTYPDALTRCMVDMLNEPDSWGLSWDAQDGLPASGDLYLAAMDAIYQVNSGRTQAAFHLHQSLPRPPHQCLLGFTGGYIGRKGSSNGRR